MGTIGNMYTKAHAKYERNIKQENIWEGQFIFENRVFVFFKCTEAEVTNPLWVVKKI